MTNCANAEQSDSVGGGAPLLLHSTFSQPQQRRVCFREWKRPERRAGQRKGNPSSPHGDYESRSIVMRDKMSDTKVHVTCEQPWVAEGGGAAQTQPQQNVQSSGRKCSRGPPQQCPGPGKTAGTSREGGTERTGKRIKDEEGRNEGETKRGERRVGKTEEERKWKCVRSENQKCEKKQTDFYIEEGKQKNSNTLKQKRSTKGKLHHVD